jgi:hypothetical protein
MKPADPVEILSRLAAGNVEFVVVGMVMPRLKGPASGRAQDLGQPPEDGRALPTV